MKKNFEFLYETLGGTYREENGHLIPNEPFPNRPTIRSANMDGCTLITSNSIVAEGTPRF